MWRILFVAFLIAHGLVHLANWLMPRPKDQAVPFDANHSWLLGDQRALAMLLAVAAATFLVAGGLGLWAHADWWRGMAVVGLAASFGLMIVYFNPWLWGAFIEFRAVTRAFVKGWSQLPKAGFDDAVGLGSCVRPKGLTSG